MAQSNDAYKSFFYDMPIDLCCVIHPDTQQILQANIAFENLLGWKVTEIIGKKLEDFLTPASDRAVFEKLFSKLKLGVHSLSFEMEFRTKNNLNRWIDWKCYADEKAQQIFAIGRDITSLKEAQKSLSQQFTVDQLTGLNNQHTFHTLLDNELHGALRYHYPTAVIIIAIDHYKTICTHNGIQKSHECVKQVAAMLKSFLRRKTDFLARLGDAEFGILLSHNDLPKALKVAEYLHANLQKLTSSVDSNNPSFTVSIGVSAVSEAAKKEVTADNMMDSINRAVSLSEKKGGNQINFMDEFE